MSALLLRQIKEKQLRVAELKEAMENLEKLYDLKILDSKEAEQAFKSLTGTVTVKLMSLGSDIKEHNILLEQEIHESAP